MTSPCLSCLKQTTTDRELGWCDDHCDQFELVCKTCAHSKGDDPMIACGGPCEGYAFADLTYCDHYRPMREELLPPDTIKGIVEVLSIGSAKHGTEREYLNADPEEFFLKAIGHAFDWKRGQTVDSDSGKSSLLHAITRLILLHAMTCD